MRPFTVSQPGQPEIAVALQSFAPTKFRIDRGGQHVESCLLRCHIGAPDLTQSRENHDGQP
jgi:hypothetical protein